MKKSGLIGFLQKLVHAPHDEPRNPPFTPRAQTILNSVVAAAPAPTLKDVAIALIEFNQGVHAQVLQHLKVDLKAFRSAVEAAKTSTPLNEVLTIAHEERRHLLHTYLGTEHLLLATIRCLHDDAPFFEKEGLDLETFRAEILRVLDPNFEPDKPPSEMPT